MQKSILITLFLVLYGINLSAQKQNVKDVNAWQLLSMVTFNKQIDELTGMESQTPTFHQVVEKLNGQEVTVKGYILPIKGSKDHKYFIFSAYPYNMCFFCGGAGPESVMEINAKSPIKYTTKMITLRGKLRLNYGAMGEQLIYTLENARRL